MGALSNILIVAYLLIVLALIAVILLQRSEGGGLGMGSNSNGLMSVRGSANLLTRTTAILAALFFATSVGLTIISEFDNRTSGILAGLIGKGIQASRTPAMHEREGDAQGLRYLYRLIDLDQLGLDLDALPSLLDAAQHMGFTGLNITFPAKQAIIPLLDELSSEARGIGAVNTVVLKDGKRVGHNTDCLGFAEGLRRGLPNVARRRVVQMGAGGAAGVSATAAAAATTQRPPRATHRLICFIKLPDL